MYSEPHGAPLCELCGHKSPLHHASRWQAWALSSHPPASEYRSVQIPNTRCLKPHSVYRGWFIYRFIFTPIAHRSGQAWRSLWADAKKEFLCDIPELLHRLLRISSPQCTVHPRIIVAFAGGFPWLRAL